MVISTWKKIASVFLGLILSLLLLEAGFRLGGFVQLSLHEYGNLQSIKQKDAYRILCLGDSTTQMQYPSLLEQVLNQRNIGVRFSVIDKGSGGTNVPAILSRIESFLAEFHPDMVVAMMGNDERDFGYFQDISKDGTWIYRHCLLYRFVRMRFMHMLEKIEHENIDGSSGSHPNRKTKPESVRTVSEKADLSNGTSAEKVARLNLKDAEGTRGPTNSYRNGGKVSKTEASLKKAIELHPENDMAYVELGRIYLNQGKLSQAEDLLGKAIFLDPENKKAYAELEKLYRLRGKAFQVEDFFKKAIELDPKNDKAYVGLGRYYLVQKKDVQAEDSFKKAIELNPKNATAYVGLGYFYQRRDEFSHAEDSFKKAIEMNPRSDKAYAGLGRLYIKQGKLSQAEDSYRRAIEMNPEYAKAYFELGQLYKNQGKSFQAEDSFKKAIEMNPEDDKSCIELGRFYRSQDKLSQAEDVFKKAIEINPKNDAAYVELGRLYSDQGKLSQAHNLLKKAGEINPLNNFIGIVIGESDPRQAELSQTEDSFKKAIENNPENADAYVGLGYFYQRRGEFSQAENSFKKALEIDPRTDKAYMRLAELYKYQGKFPQAEDAYMKAIEFNPTNESTLLELGQLYREEGKFSQAEDLFKKAIRIINFDRAPELLLRAMASFYEEMGKPELAKAYAEKAASLNSENYPPITVNNYRKLKAILDRKGIKLVCVQYPMRNLKPLTKIFENGKGVIFVDNERVFKEAVRRSSYKEYFRDMMGGDFGHCTSKGNMLLAQNIADVILREVFNRQ
jgi:tetratricopeptide (TPR) repeat protein